jgi:hypothetical protein
LFFQRRRAVENIHYCEAAPVLAWAAGRVEKSEFRSSPGSSSWAGHDVLSRSLQKTREPRAMELALGSLTSQLVYLCCWFLQSLVRGWLRPLCRPGSVYSRSPCRCPHPR